MLEVLRETAECELSLVDIGSWHRRPKIGLNGSQQRRERLLPGDEGPHPLVEWSIGPGEINARIDGAVVEVRIAIWPLRRLHPEQV